MVAAPYDYGAGVPNAGSKPEFFVLKIEAGVGKWLLRAIDDPISLFTLILSIFTIGLYRETAGLRKAADQQKLDTRESLQLASQSALAAERSTAALLGVELPRLELESAAINLSVSAREALSHGLIDVVFKNHGRTTAHIVEDCVVATLADFLPLKARYPFVSSQYPAIGSVAAQDGSYKIKGQGRFSFDELDSEIIMSGTKILHIYGYVIYRDFFSDFWISRFHLQLEPAKRFYSSMSPSAASFRENTAYSDYTGRARYDPTRPIATVETSDFVLS